MAMHCYALDHKGFFPRQDLASGQNLWDVSNDFYDIMKNVYGLPHPMFFCPTRRPDLAESLWDRLRHFHPSRIFALGAAE